jgi:hypothetical protein
MSRARHKANGGPVKQIKWNAEGSNTMKEADEKAKGGRIKGEGMAPKMRMDRAKRAAGGSVIAKAAGGPVDARARGGAVPGRARGGGIGADMKPLTTAARVKHVTPGETPEDGDDKVM